MSVFDGVAKELETLGPLGSAEWLSSWAKLETAVVISLAAEDDMTASQIVNWAALNLSADDLADRMAELCELWWSAEALVIMTGQLYTKYFSNAFCPPMPGDPDRVPVDGRYSRKTPGEWAMPESMLAPRDSESEAK